MKEVILLDFTIMIETDILVIGAGPCGLFTVFEAGLLKLRCHLIDALPQAGGQLTEIYPKKPIYDIPGFPEILAGELIDNLMKQEVKTILLFSNILWILLVVISDAYKIFRVERIEVILSKSTKLILFHSLITALFIVFNRGKSLRSAESSRILIS